MQSTRSEGAAYLQERFGLSTQEADRRLALQDRAEDIAAAIARDHPDGFLGMEIQHEPVFKIVISVSRGADQAAIRNLLAPDLRSVIRFRVSKYDRKTADDTMQAIFAALGSIDFSVAFDYPRDRFVVSSANNKVTELIPPALRPDVFIQNRPSARPMQANGTTADTLYAGWAHYGDNGSAYYCTLAFAARDSAGRNSILTAEHCQDSITETRRNNQQADGVELQFYQPVSANYRRYEYNAGFGRSYDFRLLPAQQVTMGPALWYFNPKAGNYAKYEYTPSGATPWTYTTVNYSNQYSGLPGSGYIYTVGAVGSGTTSGTSNPNHPIGPVRCKSGNTTGVTCGTISASTLNSNNIDGIAMYGLVEIANFGQPVAAWGGDSGGPVFSQPIWNSTYSRYEVRAAGISHGGEFRFVHPLHQNPTDAKRPCDRRTDGNCTMVYLPIDRVNDFEPVTIELRSGASASVYQAPG